ncbi:MAG: BamA/TamA family outer membrane protein [Acidobacteriia bacterium]|nr:BamA/TamA family outer membrane protein [Terriglobia bacterium]
MPLFRPALLAYVLCLGVCAGQQPASVQAPAANPAPQPETGTPDDLNSLQGLKVARVEIKSPGVEHPEWFQPLLPQKVNEPLDKYKVRRSVQVLYDTGRFAAIQVEAQRTPAGEVTLTFAARESFFFGSITAEHAPSPPGDSRLVNASKLTLGEQFTEDKIKTGIAAMQRSLQENGYYQATITPSYEWDSRNRQVAVHFSVNKGKPARVGLIKVGGSPGYTAEEVRSIAKLHNGNRVTASRLTKALQRLRKRFQKKQRLEAQVTLTQRDYHPESNTLDYTFEISGGPIVDVKVEGAKLRRGLIKKYVPVYEENAVDEDLLQEGARNLRDYFQTKGYFDVRVTYTQQQSQDGGRRSVVYKVERNDRHKFAELTIEGNHYFRPEDIRERMVIQPAGGLLVHGVFSQSLLARDIQAIENLYRGSGFLQVKVTPAVTGADEGRRSFLKVKLTIQEGPQTTVGKLDITGNSAISDDDIRKLIAATEGQPYSDATILSDQTEVMDAYFNKGFSKVQFEYATQPEPGDATKINVTYKITEGPQVFVDQVLISGLHYTRPFVVDREVRIPPGSALSQQDMLSAQRRLYDLGIFNEVNMAVQNPDGQDTRKNVNFELSEAKRYTFSYGGGLEVQTGQPTGTTSPQGQTGASPRVSFDITRLNFRGRAHTLSLKTRYGNLEKLALLGFEAPRWFDSEKLSLAFTAFYEQTNDVRTFTAKRLEGSAEIKQTLNKATTLLYRFIYRKVATDNLAININAVPLFSQAVRVGMPDFSYLRDTRDNPIDSRKGSFTAADIGVASGAFGSQASFVRLVVQNSTYYQFHKRRWVFARSTRIGIEEPFGNTSAAIVPAGAVVPSTTHFIPLPERFLAGGSTTQRGFGVNQAGPRDLSTGFPLGGEAQFINNLELRTPPLPLPFVGNNLSVVLFHDMGNIFATPKDMVNSFYKFHQPNRSTCLNPALQTCNFNYVSHAVGGGVRYRTPIGPVSFDLGYNLNPPAFPVSVPIQPSPPAPPVQPFSQVLRHFNFFFNIGQTF